MPKKQMIAQLHLRLKGFEKADTDSQLEGFLDPGKYVVEKYEPNFPNPETDYALVQAPALGAGDTWICTRWKDHHYAEISEVEIPTVERLSFEEESFAIPETALIKLLSKFRGYSYDLDEAHYPYPLPGVRLPQKPPKCINCCTFAEALLVRAWADVYEDFEWGTGPHAQMMILSNDDFFSPITAVIDKNMAVAVPDPDTPPHPWTLIQGWRYQWRSGHTFIIVDHDPETDRVLTLESNSSYRINGVGFRALGNLSRFRNRPPEAWWDDERLWSWERICSTYRFRRQARLKVKERRWSGLEAADRGTH